METTMHRHTPQTEKKIVADSTRLLQRQFDAYSKRLDAYERMPEGYMKRAEFCWLDCEFAELQETQRTLRRRIERRSK